MSLTVSGFGDFVATMKSIEMTLYRSLGILIL